MKIKTVLLWVIALFVIDQMVKIVIDRYFLDLTFDIIPPLFYFKPTFNHQYSWINGLFHLGMGFWTHIILYSLLALPVIFFYDLMKTITGNNKLLNISFVFFLAGYLSAYIGTIAWNGCLDYIYLKPLFVFDLKDLYINSSTILFLLYYHKNRKQLSALKTKDVIQHVKNKLKTKR